MFHSDEQATALQRGNGPYHMCQACPEFFSVASPDLVLFKDCSGNELTFRIVCGEILCPGGKSDRAFVFLYWVISMLQVIIDSCY